MSWDQETVERFTKSAVAQHKDEGRLLMGCGYDPIFAEALRASLQEQGLEVVVDDGGVWQGQPTFVVRSTNYAWKKPKPPKVEEP